MKYKSINEAIAAVTSGETTAVQAAADIYPDMSYAIKYYNPQSMSEVIPYKDIVTEWRLIEASMIPPVIVSKIADPRKRTDYIVEMEKCTCGHTIPKFHVMSASRGTSCPSCYDRMS